MPEQTDSVRRNAILRAAEQVFGHHGFEGASIRLIANAAGVNSALVGYYFGAKSELYETVFAMRYRDITEERMALLAKVRIAANDQGSLRAVLEALLRPFVERLHTEESRDFAMMLANEALDPRGSDRHVFEKYLNPTARRFIAAIREALPKLSRGDVAWGYQFCVFVMLSGASSAERVGVLAGGATARETTEALIQRMISYCAAGLAAVSKGDGAPRQRAPQRRQRADAK